MDERALLPDALAALSVQFAPDADDRLPALAGCLTMAEVKRFVENEVSRLLDRNPALLMSILYRVDVAERDVRRVFEEVAPGDVPSALADLLIARQLQKIHTRKQHQ